MKAITEMPLQAAATVTSPDRSFVIDTTLVLFFLALDAGHRFTFGAEGLLTAITLGIFLVLPYFLPFDGEKPRFERWVLGRTMIAGIAIIIGAAFSGAVGTLLPEGFRFVPLTLLIAAGFFSCIVQLRRLFRYRLAN
jgi:hypothetical protein